MEGSNILRKAGIVSLILLFQMASQTNRSIRKRSNHGICYWRYTNLAEIIALLNEYNELDLKRRIKPIQISARR
jgi:hypothetical protein